MFLVPDHVGIGLRNLSTRLRSIKLINIRISPSLFWPGADEQQSQTDEENSDHDPSLLPSWPNLETFEVSAELPDTVAASRPVESINEIIAAVGHAARRMPKLKFMEVDVDAPHHDMWAILKVRSAAAGETNCEFTWDSGRALPVSWSKETVKAWGLEGEGVLRVQRDGSEWSAVAHFPWLGSSSGTV
ncbi:hypothetical protein BFW01_g2821 [Lasiodiplodia theobromae]|nr:hypothetical protein BFW01_g2821 [Lasiodiplodia theobromae]